MTQTEGPHPILRPSNAIVLLALPALLPAVAPHLPVRHWVVDLPASYCLQAGVVLLGAALCMVLASRWKLAGLFALGTLSTVIAVAPGWVATTRIPSTVGEHRLTLLTMNLARDNERNVEGAYAEIQRVAPDVLFLSEVTPAWWSALGPRLREFPYFEVKQDPSWFGVALLSKQPLANLEVIPLGYDWAPAVRAELQTSTGPIGLLGVHAPRPGREQRCAERDAALAAIAEAIAPLSRRRVVLGDFNATPWNRSFPAMLDATDLRHASRGRYLPSWPTGLPWPLRVPIDHVLVSSDLAVEQAALGEEFGSDHVPLQVVLRH